jgi:hypothetical protein
LGGQKNKANFPAFGRKLEILNPKVVDLEEKLKTIYPKRSQFQFCSLGGSEIYRINSATHEANTILLICPRETKAPLESW